MTTNQLVVQWKGSAISFGRRAGAISRAAFAAALVRVVHARDLARGGLSITRAWFLRLPLMTRWAFGGAIVAAALGAFLLLRTDPVERAVQRGDLHTARKELRRVHGPSRAYDAGRIQEAQRSYGAAAASYASAARNGDSRGLTRLIEMTRHKNCRARTAAAGALGDVGDDRSVRALRTLSKAKFADERGRRGPFACNSRRAARDALDHARDRG